MAFGAGGRGRRYIDFIFSSVVAEVEICQRGGHEFVGSQGVADLSYTFPGESAVRQREPHESAMCFGQRRAQMCRPCRNPHNKSNQILVLNLSKKADESFVSIRFHLISIYIFSNREIGVEEWAARCLHCESQVHQ